GAEACARVGAGRRVGRTFGAWKMLFSDVSHVPGGLSLGVVASLLVLSVAASLIWPERVEAPAPVRRTSAEPGQPGHRAAAADAEPAPDAGEAPDTFGSAGSGA